MTDTRTESPGPRVLSRLDEAERHRLFDDLQQSMPGVWDSIRRDLADESVVVVPSISLEHTTAGSGTLMQAMEERALFLLLLLRQPRLRMRRVRLEPAGRPVRLLPRRGPPGRSQPHVRGLPRPYAAAPQRRTRLPGGLTGSDLALDQDGRRRWPTPAGFDHQCWWS